MSGLSGGGILLGVGLGIAVGLSACASGGKVADTAPAGARNADDFIVVDCLLPGQMRKLGESLTYLSPRRPIKTSSSDCEIRGGEYVAYDRANYATALKIWLPQAQEGDPAAQTYVGEIYEKGLGIQPDYRIALEWYRKAAEQGYSRAQINLGYMYESGLGVPVDLAAAMNWYRKASGLTEGDLEYVSSVEIAQRQAAAAKTQQLEQEVTELRGETETLRKALQDRRNRLKNSEQEVARLTQELDARKKAAPAATNEAVPPEQAQGRLSALESERQRLIAELAQQQVDSARLRQELEAAQGRVASHNDEITALQAQLADARAELDRNRASASDRDAAALQALQLQSRIAGLESAIAGHRTEIATIERDGRGTEQALQQKLAAAADKERALQDDLRARDADLAALRVQLSQRTEAVSGLEKQLRETQAERARLNAKLEAQQTEARQLRDDLQQAAGELAQRRLDFETTQNELALAQEALQQSKASAQPASDARASALERRIRDLNGRLQTQKNELALTEQRHDERVAALQAQVAGAQKRESELALTLNSRSQEIESLRAQAQLAQQQLAQKSAQSDQAIAKLEDELKQRQAEIAAQRQEIEKMQSAAAQRPAPVAAAKDRSDMTKQVAAVAVGPTIEIIEPPLAVTRGVPTVQLRGAVRQIEVIGRVSPVDALLTFKVNDEPQKLDEAGLFKTSVQVQMPETAVRAVAVDKAGMRTAVDFMLQPKGQGKTPAAPEAPATSVAGGTAGMDFGTYHALVIGNNNYRHMPGLATPGNDARAIAQALETKYGFKVTVLIDADRYAMLSALNKLRQELTEKDNLLVYFAGHGEIDTTNSRGYWLPVDAEADSNANWISNVEITDILNVMAAKHVLVVADSCYSGTLTRSSVARLATGMSDPKRREWYEAMAKVRSRLVLSSGGEAPVLDAGGGEHSVFAKAFLEVLTENRGILEGFSLYQKVQSRVRQNPAAAQISQSPRYAPIKYCGHEAGEFLFPPVSPGAAMLGAPRVTRLASWGAMQTAVSVSGARVR